MTEKARIQVTAAMVAAGVHALSQRCPLDVAFPVGGEEIAVEEVLTAALAVAAGGRMREGLLG